MKYIELCAGTGGLTLGLDNAGLECVTVVDNDPDCAAVHPHRDSVFQTCDVADAEYPSSVDVVAAGFPCQPFSSSGHRSGFHHRSGNVFTKILEVVDSLTPSMILLENVQGLLSNKRGHTFHAIINELYRRGYSVEWRIFNALEFGVPQDRKRVFIVASSGLNDLNTPILQSTRLPHKVRDAGGLTEVLRDTRMEVGYSAKKVHAPAAGRVVDGRVFAFVGGDTPAYVGPKLGDAIAPGLPTADEIRSVRYWAHSGKTRAYFKKEFYSHSIGTSIGAAPLFGYQRDLSDEEVGRLEPICNWSRREPDGSGFVFRAEPVRALPLFGDGATRLAAPFLESGLSSGRLYRLLGNMVVPAMAQSVAQRALAGIDQAPTSRSGEPTPWA